MGAEPESLLNLESHIEMIDFLKWFFFGYVHFRQRIKTIVQEYAYTVCAHISQEKPLKHNTNYQNDKRMVILKYNLHNLNENNMII